MFSWFYRRQAHPLHEGEDVLESVLGIKLLKKEVLLKSSCFHND